MDLNKILEPITLAVAIADAFCRYKRYLYRGVSLLHTGKAAKGFKQQSDDDVLPWDRL